MAIQLIKIIPVLKTAILQSTIDFYTGQLGFTCTRHLKQYRRATLKRDRAMIIFYADDQDAQIKIPRMSTSIYIYMDDVDALWTELKDKAEICEPLGNREWDMRQFSIFDNNGYVLIFAQPVKEEEEDL